MNFHFVQHTLLAFSSYFTVIITAKTCPQKFEQKFLNPSRTLIDKVVQSESKCAVLCNKNSKRLSFRIRFSLQAKYVTSTAKTSIQGHAG